MAEKRQLEILLLRLVPHALRDDFMTVGLVVLEDGHQPSAVSRQDHFVEARFTRDWKRVACFAPDFEIEVLEQLEEVVRSAVAELGSAGAPATSASVGNGVGRREMLLRLLDGRFGPMFDVGPVKALEAEDPAAEMRVLERDYLDPMRPAEHARRLGRMGIVGRMQDAFAEAGVLGMLQRDLDMRAFTGEHDPFRVDFGFRVGTSLKMFQGLALNLSREPAVTLAYRYGRIQSEMRGRGEEALLTAIVSEEATRARGEVGSGIAMLRASKVEVRGVEEMGEIAERVRAEVRG